ncbi:YifB family Mg chelatase-like AAA ATPase [Bacillus sp. FJAT-22090]|uniref:YifB family Mg chelatase-like AAA ATPase n=1 Tax=Bacillus sp. FJAT-22090 TaxID=1581038 RepID=UPI001642F6E2|nr:YifB family Mg chelatase-like AAA ATPase [Bacillus sp. FJAT-22090]
MVEQVMSVGLEGMKGHRVVIEANVRDEKEACIIIGLPDAPMKESKERILSCLHTLGIDVSMKKITIHLSPADKRKTGTGHDCAMLIAVLQKTMLESIPVGKNTCFLSGLSLTGNLVPFHGLIPAIQQAVLLGFERIILPPIDIGFLEKIDAVEFVPIHTVTELINYLCGQQVLDLPKEVFILSNDYPKQETSDIYTDFASIRGHREVKRALEIAAAGSHHVLLNGPPGCGKTMLADAFQTILPDLSNSEMLETYGIYHLAKESRGFSKRPPYRHPHHSASAVSLVGGGTFPKPGEISLAHKGVLFLDELGEFSRKALDMLRQPMETGEVTINRVRQSVTYPSSFTLIAATNPCPCGYYGSNERYCTCTSLQVKAYQLKASGPLLDRIDIMMTLQSVGLTESGMEETSEVIRKRVEQARWMQKERYTEGGLNGNVPFALLLKTSMITDEKMGKLQTICFEEKWSNRTQAKLIRLSRTIADLSGETKISDSSIEEAIKWKRIASSIQNTTNERTHNG